VYCVIWLFTPRLLLLILTVATPRDGQAELPCWLIKYQDEANATRIYEPTHPSTNRARRTATRSTRYYYAKLPLISIVR